ncbi:hypothetical protein LCGC14_2162120 [marine sediment metagenome]|uniref:Uncharacterized protein n=1 Tax=marine sediment metagenome TaxID=412755 RepID=A0A0F9GNL5_9ZZZZ
MKHEEDFVNEGLVEFEIDSKTFVYKPTTAGDETSWMDEYIEIGPDNKPKQNFAKITQCKLRNLVNVPYDQELISKMIKVDKPWEKLDKDQRWAFLSKLKPVVFNKIITKVNSIDEGTPEKKN